MSTSYLMTVRRKADRKIIGKVYVDDVKSVLYADEDLVDTHGKEFRLAALVAAAESCDRKIADIEKDIRRLEDGVFKCKSVEVKREVEEDIGYKKESLNDYKGAWCGIERIIGKVYCLAEDMLIDECKKSEGEEESESHMAYSYWKVETGEKDERGYEKIEYCWAEDVLLTIDAKC